MEKTYIFGHHNPDTDSVCSAIALADLKNQLGDNAEARILDDINKETEYVLNYFKVKKPKVLDNVKLQIKNVNYHKDYILRDTCSIREVHDFLIEKGITGVPIVEEDNTFAGLITLKIILHEMIEGNLRHLITSYDNVLKVLKAREVLRFNEEIEGDIVVGGYRSSTFVNEEIASYNVLIVGNRPRIINFAIKSGIKTIIITGTDDIDPDSLKYAKEKKVNVIKTDYDTFYTTKLINWAGYAKNFCYKKHIVSFNDNDYFNDFVEIAKKLKHNNYPVVNSKNKCIGLLRSADIEDVDKKNVILVDHNETGQSVSGLYQANIVEIIDHHKIGDLTTSNPINFRNMAVGSTCTIVYQLYKDRNIEIPKDIAGLLLSGILSDTLILKSPTTTEMDVKIVNELSNLIKIDYEKYGFDMFKYGTSIEGQSIEDILKTDVKTFELEDGYKYAVSQVFTLEIDSILNRIDEYIKQIEDLNKEFGCNFTVVAVTDILKNGSYFMYTEEAVDILKAGYNIIDLKQGIYIDGVVSRKKQIVPNIIKGSDILK